MGSNQTWLIADDDFVSSNYECKICEQMDSGFDQIDNTYLVGLIHDNVVVDLIGKVSHQGWTAAHTFIIRKGTSDLFLSSDSPISSY